MNIDKEVLNVDLAWERELVSAMPQECVGDNVALVSMTRLLVKLWHCLQDSVVEIGWIDFVGQGCLVGI